jgi:methionine synthase II (cobalamin-independent)
MTPSALHDHQPDASFDGGDLDCGSGLLLLIRKHIDPLARGQLLEIRSTEISVDEDLPAWCRLTGNELVSWTKTGKQRSFLVCKDRLAERGTTGGWPRIARAPVAAAPAEHEPLVDTLREVRLGAYLLEMCTPRSGETDVLKQLPDDARIGIGVVNQKQVQIEALGDVSTRIERAIDLFGAARVMLHPDCGFATFADNPICSSAVAEQKLQIIARAVECIRD